MDTKPRRFDMMDDCMIEVLRAKSSEERLAIANGMWRFARNMIEATLRSDYPDRSDVQIERETARRMSHGAA